MNFFIQLRRDKGLSVSEIKGYRATLNSVLTLKGLDLSTSKCCSGVSRGLFLMGSYGLPLGMLLLSFSVLPVPLKSLFGRWMIIFLLTKCSSYWPLPVKHVGKLHALSFRVSHSEGWSEASFRFVPDFVVKTQDASSHDLWFEGFCVLALPKSSTNPTSRLLCPVRAVRCYLCPHCSAM